VTQILTVRVANSGAESYELTRYDACGGGRQSWSGTSMDLKEFADLVVFWAASADFVCVDETGLGGALVDMLAGRGLGTLQTHRMRPLEYGLKP
jgi:hypothetical protein